jgi:hypothetical protein
VLKYREFISSERFTIRATGTCACRVSAVAVNKITTRCFNCFQSDFFGFFGIISPIVEALNAERGRDEYGPFNRFIQLLILRCGKKKSELKFTNILGDSYTSVLYHSM